MIGIRETLYKHFELDLFRFVSLTQFSRIAALKLTQVKLDLFKHPDMYLFVERSIRGGLCQQVQKYAKANNPQCEGYNPAMPESHIMYYDANNLYGYAMSQKLPVGKFEWVEMNIESLLNHSDNDDIGYLVDVDLDYPDSIHESTQEFPLAPSHGVVTNEMLSDYQKECIDKHNIKLGKDVKFLLTCETRKYYIVHYRLLKFFVEMGLKVIKIHRAIRFTQAPFLAPYIRYNNEQRKAATNAVAKNMFKLLNNSVYGRCLYSPRNTKSFKLAFDGAKFDLYSKKLSVKNINFLDDNVALFNFQKDEVRACHPNIIGSTVLDLSKLHMYRSYYYGFKNI